jgi:hypothetical protein
LITDYWHFLSELLFHDLPESMSSAKVPKPPNYSGERDPRIIDTWFRRLEAYMRVSNVPEDGKIDIASGYMQDAAYDWFDTHQNLCTIYAHLKRHLRAHFIPANFESLLFKEFQSMKQGQKQVSAYSLELETMAAKLPNFVTLHAVVELSVWGAELHLERSAQSQRISQV